MPFDLELTNLAGNLPPGRSCA